MGEHFSKCGRNGWDLVHAIPCKLAKVFDEYLPGNLPKQCMLPADQKLYSRGFQI